MPRNAHKTSPVFWRDIEVSEEQVNQENAEAVVSNTTDTTPSLEEMRRQAELNAQEHHDAWLRAKAETENVRRRAVEDVEKARKFALDKFAADLLAVKDSLEAALATGDGASLESVKSGVELTLKQLSGVFEKNSINEINPLGDKFDPNYHQAIGMVDAEGEPNTVATVLQKGYLLNERVIRPALVMVVKGK
jgi:molecular chaperone GrpE